MNTKNNISLASRLIILILMFQVGVSKAENVRTLVNLRGNWKFSVGDDMAWAEKDYNDSGWENVFVPKSWESNGYEDYNGFAWFRKSFQVKLPFSQEFLYLNMGQIDDVDEVYINGQLVGASGNFPPLVKTAYDVPRMYPIPASLIQNSGKNIIAIRVYDEFNEGGILNGEIGIYVDLDQEKMEIDLTGYWDFESGNRVDKGNLNCITYRKDKIFVPGFWEARGYNDCDGQAKYSKEFEYPYKYKASDKSLVLGVIDDEAKVYLNGEKLIWRKSKFNKRSRFKYSNHLSFRVYPIPEVLLNRGGRNILEVMVKDNGGPGGIYKGPIGITSREIANEIQVKEDKIQKSNWESFFDLFFD